MIREVMRLSNKTILTLEINNNTVIPPLFTEFIHIESRKFPHFLDRKWNHERFDNDAAKNFKKEEDGGNRDPLD